MKSWGFVLATAVVIGLMIGSLGSVRGAATPGSVGAWTPPRTPDGQPDIQGLWNSIDSFFTPLQRPVKLGDKPDVSEEELRAVLEEEASRKLEAADAGTGAYGHEWYEYKRNTIRRAPSLIIEPPNGRIPAMTPWANERAAYLRARQMHDPETMDPGDRCISRGILGMMLPTFYNNGKQIIQSRGYVTIVSEMIHDARIIPLDDRPAPSSAMQSWTGVPRGRWEGNTLVVESTNFSRHEVLRNISIQTERLKMTERFTAVDPNTLMYRVTIEDPEVYTAPWTIEFPFVRDNEYQMFEYACHEGNHAVENMPRGARAEERAR
jgi:hypothetical protein